MNMRALRSAIAASLGRSCLCAFLLIACSDADDDGATAGTNAPVPRTDGGHSEPDAGEPAANAGAGGSAQRGDAGTRDGDGGTREHDAGLESPPASCPTQCELDGVRCTGTTIERCVAGDDGCASYQIERDCSADSLACAQSDDSVSCEPPAARCDDGAQNGAETALDCGGATCAKCGLELGCALDRDCESGVCWSGQCAEAPATCSDAFASPADFAGPSKLAWPLHNKVGGVPRQALGSSFGEFQQYGSADPGYVHSGIDIRGLQGDYVRVVADGNIWLVGNLATCADGAGSTCRLYIKAADGRYIYYYSHLRLSDADPVSLELRSAIMNATQKGAGNYDVQAGTEVVAGQTLSAIADFYSNMWAHVHFNVFDSQQNYDGINPLSALAQQDGDRGQYPLLDDEPPFVSLLEARPDEVEANRAPLAHCGELSGAVDLIATMGDRFSTTDPTPEAVPGSIDSIGVYSAHLLIRNLATGVTSDLPWYDFSRAPFDTPGPLRGALCPVQLTEADFVARTIDSADAAPMLMKPFAAVLFDAPSSSSNYAGIENYRHIMTHGWGLPGSWDTRTVADGLYQVSVEATDHEGNRAARSELIAVDNSGTFEPASLPGDALVRDHDADTGAVPSTLGLAPSWASPDILVAPQGTAVGIDDVASDAALDAGQPYDVYVRVQNVGCGPLDGIRVRLRSLTPALDVSLNAAIAAGRDDAIAITPGSDFATDASHPGGLSLAAGARGLLGPFAYQPSSAELAAFDGARALLAELDAADDPRRPGSATPDVAGDDNAAVRSVQLRSGASQPAASFSFGNAGPGGACVQLVLELLDVPITDPATTALLQLPYDARFESAWQAVPGALIEHDAGAGTTTVTMQRKRVALPPLGLPAGTQLTGSVLLAKPASAGAGRLRISQYRDGNLSGGVDVR